MVAARKLLELWIPESFSDGFGCTSFYADALVKVVFMVRVGIVLYMMFAVSAGPSLCCCASERTLDRLFASSHVQAVRNHCCHHSPIGRKPHCPGDKQERETPPHDRCPCQDSVSHSFAISVAKSSVNGDSARPVDLSREFASGVFGAGDPLTRQLPVGNVGVLSLQNARDILSSLQTLRC